ncbi:MAG TPA: hypothetical protein VLX09_06730 [Stellaceae bacterium]|nr:hypothetical protein [Stellaceae bacterium]
MPDIPTQAGGADASVAAGSPDKPKPGLKERAISNGKKALIMMLYLWGFLAVLNLHKTVVLQQQHIDYNGLGWGLINAVILVKVMLVADDLKVGTRLRRKSLIYHTLYASFWFAVVLVAFHILEGAVMALVRDKPLSDSLDDFGAGDLRGVLSIGAIAFVGLTPFFLFREIGRVIGEEQLWRLVFKRGERKFTLLAQD